MGWLLKLFGRKTFGQKLGETLLTVAATTAVATTTAIVTESVLDNGSRGVQRLLARRSARAAVADQLQPEAQARPVA
jgi:hypothetical protein